MPNTLFIRTRLTQSNEGLTALIHWPHIKSLNKHQVDLHNVHALGPAYLTVQADARSVARIFQEIAEVDPYKTSWTVLRGSSPTLPFILLGANSTNPQIINHQAYPLFVGNEGGKITRCYAATNGRVQQSNNSYSSDGKRCLTVNEGIDEIAEKISTNGHKILTLS